MIATFHPNLNLAVSSIADGSMSVGASDDQRLANRRRFLQSHGMTAEQTVLVRLQYEGDDYRRYFTVSSEQAGDGILQPSTIVSDSLFTDNKNLALLLPVADCVAAVLYDPVRQALGLAHLGRHNLLQQGGTANIRYMQETFGSQPGDIQVWLGPAAGRANYPLHDFDNRSLHEVTLEQLYAAGIDADNIQLDPRDTASDSSLFSHSQFLKGNRSVDGRQAVVVMMRP